MVRRKIWTIIIAAAAFIGLAACGNSTAQKVFSTEIAAPARLAEASKVTGCRLLGEVRGYAEPTKSGNAPLARMTARDDMLRRAGNMGATHVVLAEYVGNRRAVAIGKAYKCD
ncbi:MAG: DUF4156 domain-containing protein [Proteobacteria bacterium]|nr:DUF4156 domain-containing protein [Pseudomonadota bacterium]